MDVNAKAPSLPSTEGGLRAERILASPQFRDGAFRNTEPASSAMPGMTWGNLKEYFFDNSVERVPKRAIATVEPRPGWAQAQATGLRSTWLGHSTVLLEFDGMGGAQGATVLTDPVWGLRASPMSFMGPKRFFDVPVAIAQLPRIDVVLISHDHYDHLCKQSVLELAGREVTFVTSLGVGARLQRWGIAAAQIVELDWGEQWSGKGVTLVAEPAQHFSGRTLADRNSTLWSSWVIKGARQQVYFSGDTGLTPQFVDIHRKHGKFDLTMIEIGAYHPSWGTIHMGPVNALTALGMLGGGTLLPVHWGTFNLGMHAWDEPAQTLAAEARRTGATVLMPRVGQVIEPTSPEDQDLAVGRCRYAAWW